MADIHLVDINSNKRRLGPEAKQAFLLGLIAAAVGFVGALIFLAIEPQSGHGGDAGHGADSHAAAHDDHSGDHSGTAASSDHSEDVHDRDGHDDHADHGGSHAAGGHGGDHGEHHGYITDEHPWGHSYLMSFMFYASLSLGAIFFVLIQHLTRAGWSASVRRLAEAMSLNIVIIAVLAIPLLSVETVQGLYHWALPGVADPASPAYDELVGWKSAYLNYNDGLFSFLPRTILFFVLWGVIAFFFHRNSVAQDRDGDPKYTRKMMRIAPLAMAIFALSLSLFSVDFLMSLDAHWFSTIFGVYYLAGSFMSAMAVLAILAFWLQRNGYLETAITKDHYHDVGKLMFAFMVFWSYAAFSQYMLIWYANIPEETAWFLRRQTPGTGWTEFSLLLFAGHFFVPFFFILSRHVKRRKGVLAFASGWILLTHWFDMYYLVMPQVRVTAAPKVHDFAILIGMGGIFLAGLIFWLRRASLVAEKDPRLTESLAFENF